MKKRLHSMGRFRGGLSFRASDLQESTLELRNPARGWYQIHTFSIEEEPDFEELIWCLEPRDSLVLLLMDIGSYRDKDLDEKALKHMSSLLAFFGQQDYDIILRVTYDHEGKAMEREPFLFSQVLKHLEQIGSLLQEYGESIFIFQGLLVGNWGEMHTSRFLADEKLQEMASVLRSKKGEGTYLAVRTPRLWRLLHSEEAVNSRAEQKDMGIFDDGIFGNDNHLGTFGNTPGENAGWCEVWDTAKERDFINVLCNTVPYGGEAVFVPEYAGKLTAQRIIEELKRVQVTYLNRVYDGRILDSWKSREYTDKGVWKGKSLYDYIDAHLGYRLLVQGVKKARQPGVAGLGYKETVCLEITIKNIGFAACYQAGELLLQAEDLEENKTLQIMEPQIKGWKSGESRSFFCKVPAREGKIYLAARRKRDGAPIFLANSLNEEGKVEIGSLYQ